MTKKRETCFQITMSQYTGGKISKHKREYCQCDATGRHLDWETENPDVHSFTLTKELLGEGEDFPHMIKVFVIVMEDADDEDADAAADEVEA
jgi:hypothetical protein